MAAVAGAAERQPDSIIQKNADRTPMNNHVSLEVGGRGMLYSVNYDRSFGHYVNLGAGISYVGIDTRDFGKLPLTVFPVYANVYTGTKAHRPFLTGGLSLSTFHGTVPLEAREYAGAFPSVGAGYEYRSDEGFIFRATPYLALMPKATGWFGVTFGGSF
jgi:hypothetical protein